MTFVQWCQQHAVLTKKIQRILAHCKLVDHLLFTHDPYSRHVNDIHAMNPTHAKLEKKLILLLTYQLYRNKRSYLPLPDLVLHNAPPPTSQLELTSTLHWRHVRFHTTMMVKAMVPGDQYHHQSPPAHTILVHLSPYSWPTHQRTYQADYTSKQYQYH